MFLSSQHLTSDLRLLRAMLTRSADDVNLLLHLLLLNRGAAPFTTDSSSNRAVKAAPADFSVLSACDVRFSWEEWLHKGVTGFTRGGHLWVQ